MIQLVPDPPHPRTHHHLSLLVLELQASSPTSTLPSSPSPRLKRVNILGTLTELLKLNPLPTAAHHITYSVLYLVTCSYIHPSKAATTLPTSFHIHTVSSHRHILFATLPSARDNDSSQILRRTVDRPVPRLNAQRIPPSRESQSSPNTILLHHIRSSWPNSSRLFPIRFLLFPFDSLQQINSIQLPLLQPPHSTLVHAVHRTLRVYAPCPAVLCEVRLGAGVDDQSPVSC